MGENSPDLEFWNSPEDSLNQETKKLYLRGFNGRILQKNQEPILHSNSSKFTTTTTSKLERFFKRLDNIFVLKSH
jgi:hypothetical protein